MNKKEFATFLRLFARFLPLIARAAQNHPKGRDLTHAQLVIFKELLATYEKMWEHIDADSPEEQVVNEILLGWARHQRKIAKNSV